MTLREGRVVLAASAGVLLAVWPSACGGGKGSGSSPIARGGGGKGLTYEIRGPVSKVTDCGTGPNRPKLGAQQRATSSLKLTGKKFSATIGAASDMPGRYASYTGVLRRDGSFKLKSDSSSPGDIHQAVLGGRFGSAGTIRGNWTFGLPGTLPNNLDDPHCRIRVSPLTSSFYFGVDHVDWRKAFGVR